MKAEHIEYLKKNYKSNLNEISKILGLNRITVAKWACRLGLTRKRGTRGWRITDPTHIKNMSIAQRRIGKDPAIRKERSENSKRWIKEFGHPRGMLGKHQTQEMKDRMKIIVTGRKRSQKSINKMKATTMERYGKDFFLTRHQNCYSRCKKGYREDIANGKICFRSAWEANTARLLTFEKREWLYEPKTFWFEKIRRGVRSYLPDFYLPKEDKYIEVKGWMDAKSKTKLKRMAKYYPKVKIEVWDEDFFKSLKRQGINGLIKNWE